MRKNKSGKYIFALTATAAMTALSVVLCRYFGFSSEGTPFRFEIGFLPIAFIAYMFGPIYSAAGYLLADIIGSLLGGYAPNLWISACQTLFGACMGIFLHRRNPSLPRITICFSLIAVFIEIAAKSPIFMILYPWTWGYTLITRAINALINLPIRILLYYFLLKLTKKNLDRLL